MTTLLSIAFIVASIVLALYIARKERLISFCILWFFGNLIIESSVLGLEIIFEHRTYLPSMFFFLLLVTLIYKWTRPHWLLLAVLPLAKPAHRRLDEEEALSFASSS